MCLITVIVPNYNHAPFLHQRIESILCQSYQDFEVILLDDCSSDNSISVLLEYKDHPKVSRIVSNDINSGSPFKQWDKGIEMAKGEWIWIAESDDWAEPTFLETLMTEVGNHPCCGLAYSATNWVDGSGKLLWESICSGNVLEYDGLDFIRKKLLLCNSIANVSECIFKKSLYQASQSYRYEHMRLCGDWFFYTLLAEQTSVLEVDIPLSNYRQHNTNVSSAAERDGLTFSEGLDVLDYMLGIPNLNIKSSEYAKSWGRMIAKYSRQYNISSDTKCLIRKRLRSGYWDILFFNYLYELKFKLCRK